MSDHDSAVVVNAPEGFQNHTVGHHFQTAEQEFSSAHIGTWLFLAQEILFFSGLFVAYAIFRFFYPEVFIYGSSVLDWKLGAVNTLVLLFSSFTMAMAIRSIRLDRARESFSYLSITFICGLIFMVVKYFEYSHKIHEGTLPFLFFSNEIPVNVLAETSGIENLPLFFGLYFAFTGLHGIHVLVGMGLIFWMMAKVRNRTVFSGYYTPVEMTGLYWHLVDIVWIFLFPLLYLI